MKFKIHYSQEPGLDKCSKDVEKNSISELVRSSLAWGIGFVGLEVGDVLRFYKMYATFELFESGM
ncbi:hypothetical protein [Ehrlichia japonica]|uniref:Uncharacterized protein n=1 Tax=Ehrlichia japonica TaxID=391036 RepID=X5H2N2_9RICK|nr:hypothetical protein [Ehrlichia japonica]AHX05034.1 hypothetical protein EHF_0235 [Ehrlichia japonica]